MEHVDEIQLLLTGILERTLEGGTNDADELAELARTAVVLDHQPSIESLLTSLHRQLEEPSVVAGGAPARTLRVLADTHRLLADHRKPAEDNG